LFDSDLFGLEAEIGQMRKNKFQSDFDSKKAFDSHQIDQKAEN
jgi:hypothetical protein